MISVTKAEATERGFRLCGYIGECKQPLTTFESTCERMESTEDMDVDESHIIVLINGEHWVVDCSIDPMSDMYAHNTDAIRYPIVGLAGLPYTTLCILNIVATGQLVTPI